MTVYIDQLWVLNSVVDYLLLSASGSLLGVPIQRGRLAAAGALGGIYAVLSLIPQLGFLQTVCFRLLTAALLCLCAFGQVRGILRQTVVLLLLAAAFSGITLLLTECFSAPGALIGGILLGIIEILGRAYISSQLSDAIVFAVLIVVLLVKPTGILGKQIHEKV